MLVVVVVVCPVSGFDRRIKECETGCDQRATGFFHNSIFSWGDGNDGHTNEWAVERASRW